MILIDPELQVLVDLAFPTLEELFAAGEAVEAMVQTPGWTAFQQVLDVELADQRVSGRKPLSHAEYALAHGRQGALYTNKDLAGAIVARAANVREEQASKHEQSDADAEDGR